MSELLYYLKRNRTSIRAGRIRSRQVNLEWWDQTRNLGDCLAPVIFRFMLAEHGINEDQRTKHTVHLMTTGSLIGMGNFDAVIWGSGIHTVQMAQNVIRHRRYVKYDIRAVRGPLTAGLLKSAGYPCPDIFGDPAVLMPIFYLPPKPDEKIFSISVIHHYMDRAALQDGIQPLLDADEKSFNSTGARRQAEIHEISIRTNDYRHVIDEIAASELVISSSLHGLILAESYGVPAVFLNENGSRDAEMLKYLDWYYSTGRYEIRIAHSLAEAVRLSPMPLPVLTKMQERLIRAFPYDLWDSR